MTIGQFRESVKANAQYRELCLAYRNVLGDRWDYNAVAGILIGSKIRHTSGQLHILEQHIGIGQGDNGNHVVLKLHEKGLFSVFLKYEKDTKTKLTDVQRDIVRIAPEYKEIIEFINETFCKSMNTSANHSVYYTFPGLRELSYGKALNMTSVVTTQGLIQEQDGFLYYCKADDNEQFLIYKSSVSDSKPSELVAKFKRNNWCRLDDIHRCKRDIFHLGINPRLCVNNGRLYFARPQGQGRLADNNEILSFNVAEKPIKLRKNFELFDPKMDKTIHNPYIIGNKALVRVFPENGGSSHSIYLIDKAGNNQRIYKSSGGSYTYLAINDDKCIFSDSKTKYAYDFATGEKVALSKLYKGIRNRDILFIDAQKDILYYFEKEQDACGKIIGVTQNGEVVDEWQALTDEWFVEMVKHTDCYSSFSFDGNLRVYKLTNRLPDGTMKDSIYVVDREGKCEERFSYVYPKLEELKLGSVLHIQTPSAVVVHFKDNNRYLEYMITTSGEKIVKPLYS